MAIASIYEDTNPRELKELLQQIDTREAALPDFQRDFVWDPNATLELIVSIANNYPAGSLLRIKDVRQDFASREFQGAPPLDGKPATYLILDGQQRLTSLYQAFFGTGEHRYFIDLRRLMGGAELEDAIFHLRANHKRARALEEFPKQVEEMVLPLSVLKGGNGQYAKWTKRAIKEMRGAVEEAEVERIDEALDEIGETWIQTIDDYKFPVVTLSDKTTADAVCTIFETLNRTGVKLSVYELLTARFWPQDINLRALWHEALDRGPIIREFDVDPYYMMVVIAMVARSSPSAKRSDVLNLTGDDVREWWDRAAWGMKTGLELLREECGVINGAWLPYNTILMPLAAILAKHGMPAGPAAGAVRQKVARWYWCSVFGQRYESSPTSQMAKDVTEVPAWLAGGDLPEAIRDFRFDPRMLRDTTTRQRAVYRGTIGLVLRNQPLDFHTAKQITSDLMVEQGIDDHHIFPQAYLAAARPDVPARLRDCVLNRTLIDRVTNIRIGKRPPSGYLGEMFDAMGTQLGPLLASHILPDGMAGPLMQDDFEGFLDWREQEIWRRIQQVTGHDTADALIEDVDDVPQWSGAGSVEVD